MQKFFKLFMCFTLVFIMANFASAQYTTDHVAFSDFEVGLGDWVYQNWWGAATVTQMADPTPRAAGNVMAFSFDRLGNVGGRNAGITNQSVEATTAKDFAAWLYLPSDMPDSITVKWYAQDRNSWSHKDYKVSMSQDLVKETWFPFTFQAEAYHLDDPTTFDHHQYNFGQFGIELYNNNTDADTAWGGTVYIDDVVRLGTEGDPISYFDIGTDMAPWSDAAWGTAMSSLEVVDDPTGTGNGGVLALGLTGNRSTLGSAMLQTRDAHEVIGYRLWLPADFPDSMFVETAVQSDADWGTHRTVLHYGIDLAKEQCIYIDYDMKRFSIETPAFDPYPDHGIGRIYIDFIDWNDDSYAGTVYIDEVDLLSSEVLTVEVTLQSPEITVAAAIDSVLDDTNGEPIYHHHIEWLDLEVSASETYNVYMSEVAPITDVEATDVVTLAEEVPRGTQEWNHLIFEDMALTRYYAVTATGIEGMEIVEKPVRPDTSNTGPITSTAANAYNVIPLVESFDFAVDGDLNEFQTLAGTFPGMVLHVQQANGDAIDNNGGVWDKTDLDFTAYLAMTAENFYIGFDVFDDDPSGAGQAWEGDGLDVFGVMTDWTDATSYYLGTDAPNGGEGGYRISYGINAATIPEQLQKNGGGAWNDATGVDHGKEVFDDGYVVEIMAPWTSMAAEFNSGGAAFVPAAGMLYPTKIDVNDNDDSTRTLQGHWGGTPSNTTSWMRAEGWTPMKIVEEEVAIGDNISLPRTTRLFDNYPNPFNPRTTIKYELAKTSDVKITIYNSIGQKVRTLLNKRQSSGEYQAYWNGKDDTRHQLPTGVYFLKFETVDYSKVQKMILMK